MEELWRDVVGYEGLYKVSNLGNVKSVDREVFVQQAHRSYSVHYKEKLIATQKRNHGYLSVCLYGRGGNARGFRQVSVHRMVAEAFIPNPCQYPEVNHKDENKCNNRADNLEWVSHVANSNHGTRNERGSKTRTDNTWNMRSILQINERGECIARFLSARDAGRKTGFDYRNIYNALYNGHRAYGYTWRFAD